MDNPKYPEPKFTRGFKISIVVLLIFLVIIVTLSVTLFLTIFKPKDPDISIQPVGLKNLEFFQPNKTSVPLGMIITIVNPNYGTFQSQNTTGYLKYRDTVVAKVPLEAKSIPARGMSNVSTTAGLMSDKLISDSNFLSDIEDGTFNLTSNATLRGKVQMFKVLKLKAMVYIWCDIFFNISSMDTSSSCISKIKL